MREYQFEIPFPPSINGYWRTFQNRQIISKKGREYRKNVCSHMVAIKLDNEGLECRLSVYIRFHPPCNRRRDLDNYTKATLDALTHAGFWEDDSQIDKLTISRAEKINKGRLVITVREIEDKIKRCIHCHREYKKERCEFCYG